MFGSGVSAGGGSGEGGIIPRTTGWANYRDTQYNEASPLTVLSGQRVVIPNNAGIKDEGQLPEDVATFYNPTTSKVLATNGSDFIITVRLRVKPKTEEVSWVKVELEIASPAAPVIETASRALPWGADVENALTFTLSGYARDAFELNGGRLFVSADGDIEVYGTSYVIKRTHKGI